MTRNMRDMKKLIKYPLLTAMMVGGFACTNLDEELKDRYTQQFTPSEPLISANVTKPIPNDGLQGAFGVLFNGTATNGGFFAVQEGGTDEAVITQKGGDWYDGGLYIRMHHHEYSPQTWGINDAWTHAYNGIFQTNTLLASAGMTDYQKGQLRMLRAYFYWRLLDVFGRVPIVTSAGTNAAQSTRAQVYAFVESELLAAIPLLPTGRPEYGRVSQGAAYGLLSRLYLNAAIYTGTAQYDKAIAAADAVINSGLYSLSANFADIFSPTNVENVEHIFVVPFDEATGRGETWAQMTLHYPSQLTWRLQQQPWNGFSTLEEFYNSYDAADRRRAASFIVGPQADINGNPILDLAFDKGDEDGPAINYTPKINMLAPNASRQAGARFGKFSFKKGQLPDMDNDFPLIRYGEILLNKAEALQRKNGFADAGALVLVNQLRTRAGATTFASMTEGQMLAERGRELFVEAHRRTDRIRFGVYCNAYWEKPADAANTTTHRLMPIPFEQMQASAPTAFPLTQNPGY
jgi:hypothetical protein